MQLITYPLVLNEAYMLSNVVKHFVFKMEKDTVFNFLPGQFITIHFEHNNKIIKRSYSIANPPNKNNIIEIAASYIKDGPGTKLLFNLNIGEKVTVSGPFGRLTLKNDIPKRYIFIATSTGITPYRSMLPNLTHLIKNHPIEIVILQGVQRQEDILYENEFIEFANKYPTVTFYSCLSRETNRNLNQFQLKGHVQDSFAHIDPRPNHDVVYLCGNPSMIDDVFAILKNKNFSSHEIIREKYISSGK